MKYLYTTMVLASALALGGCNDDDAPMKEVEAPNSVPMISDQVFTTQTDTELTAQLDGSDADGDVLMFSVMDEPMSGAVTVMDDGNFSYLPAAEVTGEDTFTVMVTDGNGGQASATVTIAIEALQLSLSSYTRTAFSQMPTDIPLSVNGRVFSDETADDYADLLID